MREPEEQRGTEHGAKRSRTADSPSDVSRWHQLFQDDLMQARTELERAKIAESREIDFRSFEEAEIAREKLERFELWDDGTSLRFALGTPLPEFRLLPADTGKVFVGCARFGNSGVLRLNAESAERHWQRMCSELGGGSLRLATSDYSNSVQITSRTGVGPEQFIFDVVGSTWVTHFAREIVGKNIEMLSDEGDNAVK